MKRIVLSVIVGLLVSIACGQGSATELSDKNFAEVQELIKPQANESRWRHIPWETSLSVARSKAAEEGKPLLIWSGGGSAPLGGC